MHEKSDYYKTETEFYIPGVAFAISGALSVFVITNVHVYSILPIILEKRKASRSGTVLF